MTATDKLRRLLDERGVEWWEGWTKDLTNFDGANGVRYQVECIPAINMLFARSIQPITPEQAIAATLGNDGVGRSKNGVGRTNDGVDGCYLMCNGKKFPVELDYGFTGLMPIAIEVGGFRYLLEGPNEE